MADATELGFPSVKTRDLGATQFQHFITLLRLLTLRAVKVRYRRSLLGVLWSMLSPLASMAVLTLVFSHVFTEVPAYALYVVVGVLAWNFFSVSCVQAMESLLSAATILRKVNVPAVVFPLAAIGGNLINLVLAIALLPFVIVATGASPGWHPALLAEALIALCAFTVGTALVLAAVNVFFHDVRYFFDALALVWFYATPIVYPVTVVPEHSRWLLSLNPMTWLLGLLRAALYDGAAPGSVALSAGAAWALAVFTVGWLAFQKLQRRFYLYL